MRLVITGVAGFIGAVLAQRAAELGHEVVGLDDLSRGLNRPWQEPSLTGSAQARIRFLRHDCRGGIGEAVVALGGRDWRPEAVVHLAAATGSLERPLDELRALNVEMTRRVWADARALGAEVFVWPATSLALGVPDSPYVRSKEEALRWLRSQPDRPRRVALRLFNVIGAWGGATERRQREVHLLPRLAEAAARGEPLTVYGSDYPTGDGSPSRDFVHVLDVADAVLALIEARRADRPVPVREDGAVWLGTGYPTTVLQAIGWFRRLVGPVAWRVGPRRPFDTAELRCPPEAAEAMARLIGRTLAPAWVGIRDEGLALRFGLRVGGVEAGAR